MKGKKRSILIITAMLVNFSASTKESKKPTHKYTNQEIVNAIYKAEGGAKAQYAYGIRSIKYKTKSEARRICFNSVRNNRKRWEKAGRPEDFILFMSRRYCPIGAKNDPHGVNKNWVKNVKYFLEKK